MFTVLPYSTDEAPYGACGNSVFCACTNVGVVTDGERRAEIGLDDEEETELGRKGERGGGPNGADASAEFLGSAIDAGGAGAEESRLGATYGPESTGLRGWLLDWRRSIYCLYVR